MEIKDFSKAQWKMHDIIQNKRKLVKGFDGKLQIRFEGKSCSPKIHRLYLSYLKELHREIERSSALLNNFNSEERHRLNLILQIDDHVETQGFGFCDLRLVLDHTAIMQLLMDQSLYGERSAGLRELIQNAVDACMVRKEQEDSEMCYAPQIIISISKSKDYVKITDNGIGMTYDTIQNYFLNIGRSYYKSDEFKFYNHKYKPIGQFGIGFLACFMLSNHVKVKTCYFSEGEIHELDLYKNSEFVLTKKSTREHFIGTEIELNYRQFFDVFENEDHLKSYIKNTFALSIPIIIKDEDQHVKIFRYAINYEEQARKRLAQEFCNGDEKLTQYININCALYSNTLEGSILLDRDELNIEILPLPPKNTFYLNCHESKLISISDPRKIEKGVYHIWYYEGEDDQIHSESCIKNKDESFNTCHDQRRTSLHKNKDSFYFISKPEDSSKYLKHRQHNIISAICSIFKENGLPFREETFIEKDRKDDIKYQPVFIMDGKFILFKFFTLSYPKQIFYKGIRVNKINFQSWVPMIKLSRGACLNYVDTGLPLELSRRNINDSSETFERSVIMAILKYLKEKASSYPSDFMLFLDELISLYQRNEIPLYP